MTTLRLIPAQDLHEGADVPALTVFVACHHCGAPLRQINPGMNDGRVARWVGICTDHTCQRETVVIVEAAPLGCKPRPAPPPSPDPSEPHRPAPGRPMPTADHTTTQEALEHASTLLALHAGGAADREAAESIVEMVQAVRDTGKKGSVTVKFEASNAGERQIILTAQVASKIPQPTPEIGIYWVSSEGLHHSDPWQQSFDAIDPDTGESREAREPSDIDPTTAKTIED